MNKQVLGWSLCLVVAGTLAISEWSGGVSAQAPPAAAYIVVLQDDTPNVPAVASEHARAYGLTVGHMYQSALRGYAAVIPLARLGAVQNDPRVRFVSEDRPVFAVAQNLPTGINRIEADLSSQLSGNGSGDMKGGPAVAIIDTGSGPHPELNVIGGVNCSTVTASTTATATGRTWPEQSAHSTTRAVSSALRLACQSTRFGLSITRAQDRGHRLFAVSTG
jgi:hypothetical protein